MAPEEGISSPKASLFPGLCLTQDIVVQQKRTNPKKFKQLLDSRTGSFDKPLIWKD